MKIPPPHCRSWSTRLTRMEMEQSALMSLSGWWPGEACHNIYDFVQLAECLELSWHPNEHIFNLQYMWVFHIIFFGDNIIPCTGQCTAAAVLTSFEKRNQASEFNRCPTSWDVAMRIIWTKCHPMSSPSEISMKNMTATCDSWGIHTINMWFQGDPRQRYWGRNPWGIQGFRQRRPWLHSSTG